MTEDVVSTEELQDYLRTFLEKNTKLVSPKFRITKPSNEGYIGAVYRVTIDGIENGEAKNIDLIVKTIQHVDFLKEVTPSSVFQREIFFYQTILPIFKENVKEHGGVVTCCPFFYGANTEFGKEMLILENLGLKGFVTSKSTILDYPHLSLALRCLGEFHAYSLITRASNPTSFEKVKVTGQWPRKTTSSFFSETIDSYCRIFWDIIKKALADEDKHYRERFVRFVDNFCNEMYDAIDLKQAEPYAVVTHGDFHTNNLLFKYDEEGKPCDIRFLDFQVCRYASPVLDIVYILFNCCAPETRSKYYDQLIREYHEALSKCLKSCGYDSNDLFPYEVLTQHLLKFGKYGAGTATLCLPIFFDDSKTKSLSHIFLRDVLENRLETDSVFRNVIKSAFKDVIDKNYI